MFGWLTDEPKAQLIGNVYDEDTLDDPYRILIAGLWIFGFLETVFFVYVL